VIPPRDAIVPADAAPTAALLELESLEVAIGGVTRLRSVSLRLAAGEILGLVGASGSGKSLTALAILGLLPRGARRAGRILLGGRDLGPLTERELCAVRGREVGMVFQEPMTALNPLLSVGAQVAETARLHAAAGRREAEDLARRALTRVGLDASRDSLARHPHELSGGQRQRVAIAMATVLTPAVLIADEPTTALDVSSQAQVLECLRELARTTGMALLLVTHDISVIAATTTRVAVMDRGRIVEHGDTRRILQNPAAPETRALVDAARLDSPRRTPTSAQPAPTPVAALAATPVAALAATPVLEVIDVVRDYPRRRRAIWSATPPQRALDHVCLEVAAGEIVGLVGESGSGKSSLLRVLLALDVPQGGSVRLRGENFTRARGALLRRLRRDIQAVFQDPYGSFDPEWSIERLVGEPCHLLDPQPGPIERARMVAEALERVGLAAADARRRPHEFSGGQRQRIAIARALITAPAVIVLDEALSALDVLVRAQILALLAELADAEQCSFLFVSHDLAVVRAIADRVYVIHRGRIVEHGPTARVFDSPQNAYTAALLADVPSLDSPLA
jgi:peptide/nickel transport system ATP-binding protein